MLSGFHRGNPPFRGSGMMRPHGGRGGFHPPRGGHAYPRPAGFNFGGTQNPSTTGAPMQGFSGMSDIRENNTGMRMPSQHMNRGGFQKRDQSNQGFKPEGFENPRQNFRPQHPRRKFPSNEGGFSMTPSQPENQLFPRGQGFQSRPRNFPRDEQIQEDRKTNQNFFPNQGFHRPRPPFGERFPSKERTKSVEIMESSGKPVSKDEIYGHFGKFGQITNVEMNNNNKSAIVTYDNSVFCYIKCKKYRIKQLSQKPKDMLPVQLLIK